MDNTPIPQTGQIWTIRQFLRQDRYGQLANSSDRTDMDNTPIRDNATRTLIHSFIITKVDYCSSVLSCTIAAKTERVLTIQNAAACLNTSNSKVCTSTNIDWRQSALASSLTQNKIQNPAAGCKLHQSKSTFVFTGTLCTDFSGIRASSFTIC